MTMMTSPLFFGGGVLRASSLCTLYKMLSRASPMALLRAIEDVLRELSVQARRPRHLSDVKEAAERGILKLRQLQESYSASLRRQRQSGIDADGSAAVADSSSEALRNQDVLRPFLLACNHTDAGPALTLLALSGIQRLLDADAVRTADGPNIMRVLTIQVPSSNVDVQVRVLQTLLCVVAWRSCELGEDVILASLLACFTLHASKSAMVRNAADASVRQVVSLLFDHVERTALAEQAASAANSDGGVVAAAGSDESEKLLGDAAQCAYVVFHDLCVLSRGASAGAGAAVVATGGALPAGRDDAAWLKRAAVAVPPLLSLELVEQVMTSRVDRVWTSVSAFLLRCLSASSAARSLVSLAVEK